MKLNLEIAKSLRHGDVIHFDRPGNRNGCERWRVSGKVQTWKRDPSRIRVPLKHGLRHYGAITDSDFDSDGNAVGIMATASVVKSYWTSGVAGRTEACEYCGLTY